MQYISQYDSPLGPLLLASDGDAIIGLWFTKQKYFAQNQQVHYVSRDCQAFASTREWLNIYFSGKEPDFTPPLKLNGSDFRLAVWKILLEIPYGCTMTYGEIAIKMAQKRGKKRMSAQAVGGAVGHNPIGIVVPCHRVVGSNGSMIGYAAGRAKKQYLLQCEQRLIFQNFSFPRRGRPYN